MKPQIKSIWLTALVAGYYAASTNGRLITPPTEIGTPTTYSSLGVLCELAKAAGVQFNVKELQNYQLPLAVAQWAEIPCLPWVKLASPSGIFNLAYLNTLGGGSFDVEAAAITEHL